MTSTRAEIRKPAYAYFEQRPTGGIYLTMWAIERQLSLAADYDEHDLVAVLLALNPELDESISADIERLLDLGELVRSLDLNGRTADLHIAIDDYSEQLRKLARLVRGIPSLPTRPRHTLGPAVAR